MRKSEKRAKFSPLKDAGNKKECVYMKDENSAAEEKFKAEKQPRKIRDKYCRCPYRSFHRSGGGERCPRPGRVILPPAGPRTDGKTE